jgi:MATE family multidrug resistance protein
LGLGDHVLARHVSITAIVLGLSVGVLNGTIIETARYHWVYLVTSDKEVIKIAVEILHVCAMFQLVDALGKMFLIKGATCGGVLRGAGLQNIGAILNFSAYYVIGLPLSMFFAFYLKMGLLGLWMGLLTGQLITTSCGVFIILKTDWLKMVSKAQRLIDSESEAYEERERLLNTTEESDN